MPKRRSISRADKERYARLRKRGVKCHIDDEDEIVIDAFPIPADVVSGLRNIFNDYKKVTGREPPDNLTLADTARIVGKPWPDTTTYINELVIAMAKANVRPELIYAFWRSEGLFVTEENIDLFDRRDLELWNRYIDEYFVKVNAGLDPFEQPAPSGQVDCPPFLTIIDKRKKLKGGMKRRRS